MCDTLAVAPELTKNGATILAKNSDREMNEPQVVQYFPAADHATDARVTCTYTAIPQARRTAAVWLSRPIWMFGAEMGINEHGVAIGNEAVFARLPVPKTGLLGMDLLRLALERATNAEQALQVIVELLADYGQGGAAGFTNKKMRYHNSFLIADPQQAWVLETVGKLWIAEKVKGVRTISNCLSIGKDYDLIHPQLIDVAREKAFLKKGAEFDFAGCFSDRLFTHFARGKKRSERGSCLLAKKVGDIELEDLMSVLTDHGDNSEATETTDLFGGLNRICMHASDPLINDAQTTGSLVAQLFPERLQAFFTGTSAPCTSVFRPVAFVDGFGSVLPDPGFTFSPGSLWWEHELLHRELLRGYERIEQYRTQADEYQKKLLKSARQQNAGFAEAAAESWSEAVEQTRGWCATVAALPRNDKRGLLTKWLHRKQDSAARIVLPGGR